MLHLLTFESPTQRGLTAKGEADRPYRSRAGHRGLAGIFGLLALGFVGELAAQAPNPTAASRAIIARVQIATPPVDARTIEEGRRLVSASRQPPQAGRAARPRSFRHGVATISVTTTPASPGPAVLSIEFLRN